MENMDKVSYKLEKYQRVLKNFYLKDNIHMYNIGKFSNKIGIKFDFKIKNNSSAEYDQFIVGSDQVWNPNFQSKKCEHVNIRFLKFAFKEKELLMQLVQLFLKYPKIKNSFFRQFK